MGAPVRVFLLLLFLHILLLAAGDFVLSSGWLASYVGQSEVPALITSLFFLFYKVWAHLVHPIIPSIQ